MKIKIVLIRSTYIFNPVSYSKCVGMLAEHLNDYDSYKNFRVEIEESIKLRNKLLVYGNVERKEG